MLEQNEMVNMARFIREKTTRCRSDVANVFDRIMELESIANTLEQLVQGENPVQGADLTGVPQVNPEDFSNSDATHTEEDEGQMELQFSETADD